jgi:hypothetical protein
MSPSSDPRLRYREGSFTRHYHPSPRSRSRGFAESLKLIGVILAILSILLLIEVI